MGVYFRTDTTRLTFGELWRISSRFPAFLRACANKVLGRLPPPRRAILHEEVIRELAGDELSADARTALEPAIADFQSLGARLAFYQAVIAVGSANANSAVLLAPEPDAIILVTWARSGKTTSSGYAATSHLQDGTFLTTTNHPRRFNTPPEYRAVRLKNATPADVLRRHRQALTDAESSPIPVRNEERAKQMLLEIKHRTFQWHVARGVWVPLTPEELARLGISADEEY